MLSAIRHRLRRDQRGFTLIETLVACATGVIVTGALFAILEFSMHQSTRLSEVAQATQLGRTAMTHVLDELHSGCISVKFAPVREGSSESKLVLIDGYGENTEVPATAATTKVNGTNSVEGVRKNEIEWSEAKKTLTDTQTLGSGETSGVYSFGGTKTVYKLLEKVSKVNSTTPIFTYYKYASSASTGTESASSTLTPMKLAVGESLKETGAKEVAAVGVSFDVEPNDTATTLKTGRSVDLNGQATFAFSAPNAESTIIAGPCE